MGQSAGGQISAVLAQRARADAFFASRPLTGQILQIPLTCFPVTGTAGDYPAQYAPSTSVRILTMLIRKRRFFSSRYKHRLLSLEQNKDAPLVSKAIVLKVAGACPLLPANWH
jgi:acetyl esterase/lipase